MERRAECRPEDGDWQSLAPQSEVDDLLGSMVSILQGAAAGLDADLVTAVDRTMMGRVDDCPRLTERAQALRRISAEAETEMERYYSRRWVDRLREEGASSLDDVLARFPYFEGYRELVSAEAALLSSPSRVIFGGGGPLPISGILIAQHTGAEVWVVDADQQAVEQSSRLLNALEDRSLIPSRQVKVLHADLADMSLDEPCGGIIVASLVDAETKIELARRIGAVQSRPPPLVLRSAIGMCSRLAYMAAPRAAVEGVGLTYRGELVPSNHVVDGLEPSVAKRFDVRSGRSHMILAKLSSAVLNSAELYSV